MKQRLLAAMSGGVDSAVAATLLMDEYKTFGATMRLHDGADADIADAARVCGLLGIPHQVLDFRALFRREVVEPFVVDYRQGLTPNPCVRCNTKLKFGAFLEAACAQGMDAIATGHYVVRGYDAGSGRWLLYKAADRSKDQSYVLYSLSQRQIEKTRFPLGEKTKAEIRRMADAQKLCLEQKAESQDICFVPDGDYAAFIERFAGGPAAPGLFVDEEGRPLGEHRGLIRYTVGQRRGLGLSFGARKFVLAKNAGDNTVVVGDEGALYRKRIMAGRVNFIPFDTLRGPLRIQAKIRYGAPPCDATLYPLGPDRVVAEFAQLQRAPAPGQSMVFYDADVLVGGGVIETDREETA